MCSSKHRSEEDLGSTIRVRGRVRGVLGRAWGLGSGDHESANTQSTAADET